MVWTDIPKPSTLAWMNENPSGREQYDQSNIEYDSSTTYYDGANPNMWTDISKPGAQSWISVAKPS